MQRLIRVKARRSRAAFRIGGRIAAFLCTGLLAYGSAHKVDSAALGPRIWDVRASRFVAEPDLVAALARARYRLLGEVHDNPAHHVVRARLIAAVAERRLRPAVVFEQFDLEGDEALIAAQSSGADAEQVADAGRLDRKGWAWPLHKPIIEAALAAHLPIRAGNVSRAQLRSGVQTAPGNDANAMWHARLQGARWTEAQAAQLRADIVESHCGKLAETMVPRLVIAQRVRDAAMAQALVDDATEDGAILVAGNGHVRADLGVPVYLHTSSLPDVDAQSVSLGLVEASPEDELAADFPRQVIARHPGFDYVWLTPPVARNDPCK